MFLRASREVESVPWRGEGSFYSVCASCNSCASLCSIVEQQEESLFELDAVVQTILSLMSTICDTVFQAGEEIRVIHSNARKQK